MCDNRYCKKEDDNMEPMKDGFIEDINLGDLELLSEQGSEFMGIMMTIKYIKYLNLIIN